jgi:predicted nucleic acid-binding protein
VDLNHHLFDTLYHAVALQSSDTFFITADTQYLRKADKLGHIIELKDFARTG